jgi:hypothetical protein
MLSVEVPANINSEKDEEEEEERKGKEKCTKMGGACCTYGERRNVCRDLVRTSEGMPTWKTRA